MKRSRDDVFVSSQLKRPAISPRVEQYVFFWCLLYLVFNYLLYFGTNCGFFGLIIFITKYWSLCDYHALAFFKLLIIELHVFCCHIVRKFRLFGSVFYTLSCLRWLVFNHLSLGIHESGCFVIFLFSFVVDGLLLWPFI